MERWGSSDSASNAALETSATKSASWGIDCIIKGRTRYEAPSREAIVSLVRQYVHLPEMPALVILMGMDAWKQEVIYAMSAKGMANAPEGHARIDGR